MEIEKIAAAISTVLRSELGKILFQLNDVGLAISDRLKSNYVLGSPEYLQVETAALCNLKCVMCPQGIEGALGKKKDPYLSRSNFIKIIDQFPNLKEIHLQGVGEPLLNSALFEIATEAVKRGIVTAFFTNGTLLGPKIVNAILETGLHRITISLDAGTRENLEKIRKGANLSLILENTKYLIMEKKKRSSSVPHVGMMFVAMPCNIDELPKVLAIARKVGIDGFTIKACHGGYDKILRPKKDWMLSEQHCQTITRLAEKAQAGGLQVHLSHAIDPTTRKDKRLRCQWSWKGAYVSSDGTLTPCCYAIPDGSPRMGNIFTEPFARIWNSKRYRSFRSQLRNGRPNICKNCPDYYQPFNAS